MEKRSNPAAKGCAIFLVILFVILGVVTLFLFNIVNQTFNPKLYKQALINAGIYQNLPKLVGEQIVYQVDHNRCIQDATACSGDQATSSPHFLKDVDLTEWEAVLSKLIDPTWFQTQIESTVDQIFSFLKTPGQPFSLNISLVEFKARLSGEDGYQAMMLFIHSLEPCSSADLLNLAMGMFEPSNFGSSGLCLPSESVLKLGDGAIRSLLKNLSDSLPDNTSTIFQSMSGQLSSNLSSALRTLQIVRLLGFISPIVPLFLLLIITLLIVRTLKGFLIWWGIPLTIIGALSLLSSLLITPVIRSVFLTRVSAQGLAPSLIELTKTIVLNVARLFENALLVQAGILCMLGVVMILLSTAVKSNTKALPIE